MAFYEKWSKKISVKGQEAVQKTKDIAEITRLTAENAEAERQIEEQYRAIGRAYFEDHVSDAEDVYPAMAEVRRLREEIEARKRQILTLRGVRICGSCGSEVRIGDAFCSQCGNALPAEAPEEPEAQENVCRVCGKEMETGAKFCVYCGTPVDPAEENPHAEEEIPEPPVRYDAEPEPELESEAEEAAAAEAEMAPETAESETAEAEMAPEIADPEDNKTPVIGEESPYEAYFNRLQEEGYGGLKEPQQEIRLVMPEAPEVPEETPEPITLVMPETPGAETSEAEMLETETPEAGARQPSLWPTEDTQDSEPETEAPAEEPETTDDPEKSAWVKKPEKSVAEQDPEAAAWAAAPGKKGQE